MVRDTALASPDSKHVAIRVSKDGGRQGHAVLVDNVMAVGPVGTAIFGPTFNGGSSRVATVVSHEGEGRLYINGDKTDGPDPIAAPVFSPDGLRVAYIGREGKQQLVYADGHSSVVYDQVQAGSLTFSSDSEHFAYVAKRNGAWFVVLHGQEGTPYTQIAGLVFSPDSQRLAYWAKKPVGGWVVVVDGQENALMSVQEQAGLWFGPDSSQLAAFGRRNGRWHTIVDGKFSQGYDALGQGSLIFSPDSKHIAFAAMNDQKWKIVLDGVIVGEFDALMSGSLQFSPNSSHLAYVAKHQEGWFAVIDQQRHRSFSYIASESLQFSSDSQRFAYVAKNDTERVTVVVDGYRWAICDGVEDLKFSPDSASVVWVERRGHASRVVVDGITGGVQFDRLVPGASLTFDGPSKFHTMVYGRPGPVFFRYEAQLYPQDHRGDQDPDLDITPAGDTNPD